MNTGRSCLVETSSKSGAAACSAVETLVNAPDSDESEVDELFVETLRTNTAGTAAEMSTSHVVRRNYLALEARKRSLDLAGDQLVIDVKRWRLRQVGCTDLANNVENTSEERGDGSGL